MSFLQANNVHYVTGTQWRPDHSAHTERPLDPFNNVLLTGLTLEGEVGDKVAFWTFTALCKSPRAKLKSLCKFKKSLCEFVKSLESRCKFHDVEEIIRKFLH